MEPNATRGAEPKIISLTEYRRRKGARGRNRIGKIVFPQLYRVSGSFYVEISPKILAPGEPAPPFYALSESETGGRANPFSEKINRLNPHIDSGWVVIRHHRSMQVAEGYLEAIYDLYEGDIKKETFAKVVYQTTRGFFTLIHRSPVQGCVNHLLIYVTKRLVDHVDNAFHADIGRTWTDYHQIVFSDGSVTNDPACIKGRTYVIWQP